MWRVAVCFLLILFCRVSSTRDSTCSDKELNDHPVLCHMLHRLDNDLEGLAEEITEWADAKGLLADLYSDTSDSKTGISVDRRRLDDAGGQLPVVFAHGMGDSCFNSGFQNIVKRTSVLLDDVYTTCIPTGKTQQEDTTNGYFMNMNDSIDVFADSIMNDPNLRNGFHAIGLSQGNNIIRGYIAKYNDPPVKTFISINGVNAGLGALPRCRPKSGEDVRELPSICDLLMEQASKRAYSSFAQQHLFQANYWRDPRKVEVNAYKTYCQLAQWNNEGFTFNQTLKDNWAKTNKFVWILAEEDSMVWPIEGEHWGAPDPEGPFGRVLPMNETEWYQKDLFGLKTAQEAGKNYFESFAGDHLQFTESDFEHWVFTYLT